MQTINDTKWNSISKIDISLDFKLEYLSAMYYQIYLEWNFKFWQQVVTKVIT